MVGADVLQPQRLDLGDELARVVAAEGAALCGHGRIPHNHVENHAGERGVCVVPRVAIRAEAVLIFVNRAAQTNAKLQAPRIVGWRKGGSTVKFGLVNTAASVAAAFGAVPLAHAQGYGPGMMGGWGWGGGAGFGIVGMVLWWVLIIVVIVLLVKWIFGTSPSHGGHDSRDRALDILRERYARGEIDKKEFEDRKRDLSA